MRVGGVSTQRLSVVRRERASLSIESAAGALERPPGVFCVRTWRSWSNRHENKEDSLRAQTILKEASGDAQAGALTHLNSKDIVIRPRSKAVEENVIARFDFGQLPQEGNHVACRAYVAKIA